MTIPAPVGEIRDTIVSIQGPGWSYGIARLLVDSEGTATVWTPPGREPVQVFKVEGVQTIRAINGRGETFDGGAVTFRRRGSGCSYKLAKCQVSEKTLAQRWREVAAREVAE